MTIGRQRGGIASASRRTSSTVKGTTRGEPGTLQYAVHAIDGEPWRG